MKTCDASDSNCGFRGYAQLYLMQIGSGDLQDFVTKKAATFRGEGIWHPCAPGESRSGRYLPARPRVGPLHRGLTRKKGGPVS